MSEPLELWLVRHGAVVDAPGAVLGQRDVPLSTTGLAQLQRLRATWKGAPPQQLWSSDLLRARASAEALRAPPWPQLAVDERLRELDFGHWDGRSWSAIHAQSPEALADWSADPWRLAPPAGETQQALAKRLAAFSAERLATASGCVVVVAHGGSLRALAAHLLALSPEATLRFDLDPARLIRITRIAGYGRLGGWNLAEFDRLEQA